MSDSFTATTGKRSTPSFSMARRITPVVVSSLEPSTPSTRARRSSAVRVEAHSRALLHVTQAVEGDEEEGRHEVGPVVHGDLGAVGQCGHDVVVVAVGVLALDGEGRHAEVLHQRRRNVVLGRQRVGGAQSKVGAACAVRMRLAVSAVTWRQAARRTPSSGRSRSKRSRIWRSTGISASAHSILRRPRSARLRSLT